MSKRGPMSLDDKKVVLEAARSGEDVDVEGLAKELDRTVNSVETYLHEVRTLGLDVTTQSNENELSEVDEPEESEMQKMKKEHMKQIIPSHKGATVMTPMGSEYTDDVNKKRSTKAKYGKYAKNVMKIKKD